MLRRRAKSPTGKTRASALQRKILGAELARLLALRWLGYSSELFQKLGLIGFPNCSNIEQCFQRSSTEKTFM